MMRRLVTGRMAPLPLTPVWDYITLVGALAPSCKSTPARSFPLVLSVLLFLTSSGNFSCVLFGAAAIIDMQKLLSLLASYSKTRGVVGGVAVK